MSSLGVSLGLPAEYFDSIIGPRHAGSIRARRYPPRHEHEGRLGTNAHVDGLPLAFIVQNDVPGLETGIPNGGWAPIDARAGTIVCQLGSLWARWTNDRYVPNRHRVVNDARSWERRSIIYWFPIHPEAIISCVPTCCGADEPARHAPIRYTQYMAEWVRSFAAET
jgi:isopenicillin N synthase-like dioxygenase